MINKQITSNGYMPKSKELKGASHVTYYKKNVYGIDKNYMHDPEVAKHVHRLTGQTTLSENHIAALKGLGHEVTHVPKN